MKSGRNPASFIHCDMGLASTPSQHLNLTKLEVKQLSFEFILKRKQQTIKALKDISFKVQDGQFLTILGPSGCGKTTLLNIIAGLLPTEHGEILLDGKSIQGPGKDRAMVFQWPALMPWRTVLNNVAYGLEIQGVHKSRARARAQHYIDLVGLAGFEESYPHELSGGMQQRVNLARALSTEPELLLLDEPLAALDPQLRENMQREVQQIWMKTGTTAIFVTHLISEAIYLGDRVMALSERPGQIREIVEIDLPRPRPLTVRQNPKFRELEDHLWYLLQRELHSDMAREMIESVNLDKWHVGSS
jgi:NitT/TauT family transport system ATP-binding protein